MTSKLLFTKSTYIKDLLSRVPSAQYYFKLTKSSAVTSFPDVS